MVVQPELKWPQTWRISWPAMRKKLGDGDLRIGSLPFLHPEVLYSSPRPSIYAGWKDDPFFIGKVTFQGRTVITV